MHDEVQPILQVDFLVWIYQHIGAFQTQPVFTQKIQTSTKPRANSNEIQTWQDFLGDGYM